MKNCGAPVHHEVACKAFMEELRTLIKSTTNEKVKTKVLEIIQTWAYAFRSEPNYRAVQDTLNLMKMEGRISAFQISRLVHFAHVLNWVFSPQGYP